MTVAEDFQFSHLGCTSSWGWRSRESTPFFLLKTRIYTKEVTLPWRRVSFRLSVPPQMVDATLAWRLLSGAWYRRMFLGRWFQCSSTRSRCSREPADWPVAPG